MASNETFELLHPVVQRAIWTMGWKQFHPIQSSAIHAVLEQNAHLLICAPTAGGKTEAAFLPIISWMASAPASSVQAIYIGPLKALINDQFARLEMLCQNISIPVHSWHGDIPANRKEAFRRNPGGILLITPESLESNFINYGTQVRRIYQDVSFVVIDELHSMIDNVRGVHLRSLLFRLRAMTGRNPRLIGLSATLADPTDARRFLDPDSPENVEIIHDQGSGRQVKWGIRTYLRETKSSPDVDLSFRATSEAAAVFIEDVACRSLETGLFPVEEIKKRDNSPDPSLKDEIDEIAEDILQTCSTSTNLVFVNSRALGEVLVDRLHEQVRRLRWEHDPFMIHHGSLSREIRTETESQLRSNVTTTAICSSTLELGIDIGSVRSVIQIDPPWTVSSMLQRLGRSGRRGGEPSIMRIHIRENSPFAGSKLEDLLFPDLVRTIAMTQLMLSKWLEPIDLEKWHLSTLVHQILSSLKQTGGMNVADLFRVMIVDGAFRNIGKSVFLEILRSLADSHIIEQTPDALLILAPDGERITSSYEFYAAFIGSTDYTIRHGAEEIGLLSADVIPPIGDHFILGGRRWRVEEIECRLKQVYVTAAKGKKVPVFHGNGGDINGRIISEMRKVLQSTDYPTYLDDKSTLLLKSARRMAVASGVLSQGFVKQKDGITWFPWAGTAGMRTLALMATAAGVDCVQRRISLFYPKFSLEELKAHLNSLFQGTTDLMRLAECAQVLTFEKYDEYLSEMLQRTAYIHNRLDLIEANVCAKEWTRCSTA